MFGMPSRKIIRTVSDFLETQLDLVVNLGLALYAQHHIGKPDED
jgi:hypothetical protein